MSRKRYVLHPGQVTSRTDGQRHQISAQRLAVLYGVDMRDCLISSDDVSPRDCREQHPGAIHLHPRNDGDYTLKDTGQAIMQECFEQSYAKRWERASDHERSVWEASWYASRAVLIIDLPYNCDPHSDYDTGVSACAEAIKAAGISVRT